MSMRQLISRLEEGLKLQSGPNAAKPLGSSDYDRFYGMLEDFAHDKFKKTVTKVFGGAVKVSAPYVGEGKLPFRAKVELKNPNPEFFKSDLELKMTMNLIQGAWSLLFEITAEPTKQSGMRGDFEYSDGTSYLKIDKTESADRINKIFEALCVEFKKGLERKVDMLSADYSDYENKEPGDEY